MRQKAEECQPDETTFESLHQPNDMPNLLGAFL
jgi:hypothetical protein